MTEVFNAPSGRGGGGLTLLVLDRAAIAALSLPGGQIWNWSRDLGKEVTRVAKEKLVAGGHVDQGTLLRSTDFSIIPVGGLVQINVRASAHHAVWFILGTPPHIINVKHMTTYEYDPPHWSAEYLVRGTREGDTVPGWMYWFRDGDHHFARSVRHPGWRGFNYLDEAKLDVLFSRGIL